MAPNGIAMSGVARYGSNNHQFMVPWLVAVETTPLFEADDLPVMVYHCRLLHEEARTLKASPNTHYLTRNSRAFI